MKKMNILLLMPIYKQMDAPCVISLLELVQELHIDGHKARIAFTNGFNAAKARRSLTAHAVEKHKEYEYVLWLDSDHLYRKEDLYKIIKRMEKEQLPMLSANYMLHGLEETAHGIVEGDKFRHFKPEEFKDKVIDCSVVGFGFLVMKADFLKEMSDKYGAELFILDAKENCTEDVKFCNCVLESGYRVCFDPKVKVGHVELAVRY